MKENMPPTNADNVSKIHFHKIGKYVDITQRHELFLICLKTNQTKALSSSNVEEQMICPLKQTEMMYLFLHKRARAAKELSWDSIPTPESLNLKLKMIQV